MPGQPQEADEPSFASSSQGLERSTAAKDGVEIVRRAQVVKLPKVQVVGAQPIDTFIEQLAANHRGFGRESSMPGRPVGAVHPRRRRSNRGFPRTPAPCRSSSRRGPAPVDDGDRLSHAPCVRSTPSPPRANWVTSHPCAQGTAGNQRIRVSAQIRRARCAEACCRWHKQCPWDVAKLSLVDSFCLSSAFRHDNTNGTVRGATVPTLASGTMRITLGGLVR